MAGRRQFDLDNTLETTMKVFWERGYAATSIDDLTAATGLGKGSIYGAFGSKDGLFRQALDRYAARYSRLYAEALDRHPDDPAKAVGSYFDVLFRRLNDPDLPDGCLLAQSVAGSSALEPETRVRAEELIEAQIDRVAAALRRGGLAGGEANELAGLVVAVQQGIAVMSRAGTPTRLLRAAARQTSATVGRSAKSA